MESWLPTINVGNMSVTMSETSRVVKRDLAVMQKVGILRHEGKGNVGVCCLLAKLAFR